MSLTLKTQAHFLKIISNKSKGKVKMKNLTIILLSKIILLICNHLIVNKVRQVSKFQLFLIWTIVKMKLTLLRIECVDWKKHSSSYFVANH